MERREKTINRFIYAQKHSHFTVKRELRRGRKTSHWMWYTFPQIKGLGYSEISQYYEIQSLDELRDFVRNKYLSNNLMELFNILLLSKNNDAYDMFGEIDAIKFQSCLTLFSYSKKFHTVAETLLEKYYSGIRDDNTDAICKEMRHGSNWKKYKSAERSNKRNDKSKRYTAKSANI